MAFMGTCAVLILAISAFVLSRGPGQFASDRDRGLVLAIAAGGLVAAAFFLNVLRTGRSLAPVHHAVGPFADLIWAAALGDPKANGDLQNLREDLRAEAENFLALPPRRIATLRATYSYTLEGITRMLSEVESPQVVSTDGSPGTKATVVTRLVAERAMWEADFAWFERLEERHLA